ncbi:MAG: DUF1214 domain-containing protein [Hyphomicrobiaceae bacterium]
MIINLIMFLLIAVAGGLGSSWYMIERGSSLTTERTGPWAAWSAAGRADADPYTRAHFIRRGMLPISAAFGLTYEAISDGEGQRLHSSCEYVLEGEEPPARFWSLSVFDENGRLIPNSADRYAYNSATLLRPAGGGLQVALARSARPGNWLPTTGAGRISLVLALEGREQSRAWQPPTIRRVACR